MTTTANQRGSLNIPSSSEINTIDKQNPPKSSITTSTSGATAEADSRPEDQKPEKTACQKAHDELEARLRDEELGARSKGW